MLITRENKTFAMASDLFASNFSFHVLSSGVTLRSAGPDDAPEAARLIYAAGPALFDSLFGPTEAETTAFFEALFALPDSLYSFENAVVAVQNGQVVGLAQAVPAAQYHRGRAVLKQILRRGPRLWLRLVRAVLALGRSSQAPPPEAFYLGLLSVTPARRGLGIGTRLLDDVHRRAAEGHYSAVCLHAELGNAGAQRLYARHGYRMTGEYPTPRAAHWGVTGFVGMRKEINPGQ